ncbi:class C sortase [Faecalicatena contorta]|uniref:Sortase A n=1 Tax=Faecalicatena contorta TaxID=39482 RepID=A0A315ZZ45_9FIRM|nr:class C sortase [Faecalicatena contorta]PWJ50539.1 sortase A [Faecalicatena contorta]SUQ13947.1 sortase A [Faecalicatena contorta]
MKEKDKSLIILIIGFLIGMGIFIYPALSNYIALRNVVRGATQYEQRVSSLSDEEISEMWDAAVTYNNNLAGDPVPDPFVIGSGRVLPRNYLSILDQGDGVMGYVDIPKINVYLPIRHGTSEEVLGKGAGHIEQTPFPTGGEGNMPVITGHTGLPEAEMFNRLTEIVIGDKFKIKVLNQTLTYQVDDIRIIEPEKIENLLPVEEKDYVTLVTCTPYGVNSHRLLVRGTRIINEDIGSGKKDILIPWKLIVLVSAALIFLFSVILLNRHQNKKTDKTAEKGSPV